MDMEFLKIIMEKFIMEIGKMICFVDKGDLEIKIANY
jgi:hypothetical protein